MVELFVNREFAERANRMGRDVDLELTSVYGRYASTASRALAVALNEPWQVCWSCCQRRESLRRVLKKARH